MKRCCSALLLAAVVVLPVQAHFVFIVPGKDPGKAQVVFSDNLEPDENVPITKIANTKMYVRGADGSAQPIEWTKGEHAYLLSLPAQGTHVVGGITEYGVLQKGGDPFRLTYCSRAIVGPAQPGLPKQAGEPFQQLDLDITLRMSNKDPGLVGQVLWRGKPLAKSEVVVMLPGQDKAVKTATDASGTFSCTLPKASGLVAVRARYIEDKPGEFGGKNYKEFRCYATLVVPVKLASASAGSKNLPAFELEQVTEPPVLGKTDIDIKLVKADEKKPAREDVEATRLLKEARQARASWEHFPGFSADLEVNHNGKVVRGSVEIGSKGNVTVKLDNDELKAWTLRQLRSLVGHRLGNAAERDTPCAFLDDNAEHPLGRAIRVLNDELHSSYRIRNRQIIEVYRTMKDTRFSITVLENSETPEKTYLPSSYVVNTWSLKTNQLVSSVAHTNQWTRVGKLDLPALLMVVEARGQPAAAAGAGPATPPLQVWTVRFSNHKLLAQ